VFGNYNAILAAQDEIADLEQADVALGRAAAYRLCVRQTVDRADRHAEASRSVRRRRERRIPIVDCVANYRGRPAFALPVHEQRRFVAFFERTGRAPLVRGGEVRPRPDPADGQRLRRHRR
jgi:hypothetical protein